MTRPYKIAAFLLSLCLAIPALGIPLAIHLGSWALGIASFTLPMLILGVLGLLSAARKAEEEAKAEQEGKSKH